MRNRDAYRSHTFGDELRHMREKRGISLRGLARRVAYSPGWLSRVENGLVPPAVKLAELCDLELDAGGQLITLARTVEYARKEQFPPAQLPWAVDTFIGRAKELQALDCCLARAQQNRSGILGVIEGSPGVGKTALAVRWAHSVADQFAQGILYHNLGGYSRLSEPILPAKVLGHFLEALGVPAESQPLATEQRGAMFRSLISGTQVLIVLDNAADSHQVAPILPGTGSSAVVITSRRRMTGLAVRFGAQQTLLRPMPIPESLELLSSVVGIDRIRAEIDSAHKIVSLCAQLPLALRIAVERVTDHWSLARLADELAGTGDPGARLDLLSDREDDSLGVRAAFEASYRRLDDEAARALRLLGRIPHHVLDAGMAKTVLDRSNRESRRILEVLVNENLLQEVGLDQYRFSSLLQLFAAEQELLSKIYNLPSVRNYSAETMQFLRQSKAR